MEEDDNSVVIGAFMFGGSSKKRSEYSEEYDTSSQWRRNPKLAKS